MIGIEQTFIRLGLAALLGGVIGLEREVNRRPAGLRTHILVSLGACLIMILSAYGFIGLSTGESSADPSRLAAQVVSGIGFLGAGTILREGNHVKGLTTAASLWLSGGIGLAVGLGVYIPALIATVLALVSLITLQAFSRQYADKRRHCQIQIIGLERPGFIGDLGTLLGNYHVTIRQIHINNDLEVEEDKISVHLTVRLPAKLKHTFIYEEIKKIQGVEEIQWGD